MNVSDNKGCWCVVNECVGDTVGAGVVGMGQ